MPVTLENLVAGELVSARRAKITANFTALANAVNTLMEGPVAGVVNLGNGWEAVSTTTTLTFRLGGVNKMRVDSSGNLTVTGNITGFGTIT